MKYVHIAGTNGKGSVAEYINRILIAAGKKCGCFTSPHIVSRAERIKIGGQNIDEHIFDELIEYVKQKGLALNDTLFAAQTAAALVWFERQEVEYAVLETGVGGRLDPTNCIKPKISVITPISLDHVNMLGSTLSKIAHEKSGIIKANVPVVSAVQPPDVMSVIRQHCAKNGAQLLQVPPVRVLSRSVDAQTFEMDGGIYTISAMGEHQAQNAAIAVCAAQRLGITGDAILRGLAQTRLRCRMQLFSGKPDMLIDGAHNVAATDALIKVLDTHFINRRKILLFACMADKDYASMIKKLSPEFFSVFTTKVAGDRGMDAERLSNLFRCNAIAENNPVNAFYAAREKALNFGALLVVAGSFYLAGIVEPIIMRNHK